MRRHLLALIAAGLTATASSAAFATETLRVYGPGGPLPAMKEAAAVFGPSARNRRTGHRRSDAAMD